MNNRQKLNMCFLLKHKSGECQKMNAWIRSLSRNLSVKKGPGEEYAEEEEGEGEHRANPIWECRALSGLIKQYF